jgi:hypothetical protein
MVRCYITGADMHQRHEQIQYLLRELKLLQPSLDEQKEHERKQYVFF